MTIGTPSNDQRESHAIALDVSPAAPPAERAASSAISLTPAPELPTRAVLHSGGIALLAIIGTGAYFLGVRPVQQARAGALESSMALVSLQGQLAAARDDVSARSARLDATRRKIDSGNVRLRSLAALNDQLGRLASLAERHGLSVQQITPAKPTIAQAGAPGGAAPGGAPAPNAARAAGGTPASPSGGAGERFARVPIRLAGSGVYTSLLAFMSDLHEADPTTRLEAFSLERAKVIGARDSVTPASAASAASRGQDNSAEAPAAFVLELVWHALPDGDGGAPVATSPPR